MTFQHHYRETHASRARGIAAVAIMRRRAGVGKLLQKKREREKAAAKGQEIEEQHLEHVEKVLGEFKEHLEQFASRHRDDINKVTIVASRPNMLHSRS